MCERRPTSSLKSRLLEGLAPAAMPKSSRGTAAAGAARTARHNPAPARVTAIVLRIKDQSEDRRRRNAFQAPAKAIPTRAPTSARLGPVPGGVGHHGRDAAAVAGRPRRAAPAAEPVCGAPRRGRSRSGRAAGRRRRTGPPAVLLGSSPERATGRPRRPGREPPPAVGRCWVYWSTAGGLATAAVAGAASTATMTATQLGDTREAQIEPCFVPRRAKIAIPGTRLADRAW